MEIEDIVILGLINKGCNYGYNLQSTLAGVGMAFSNSKVYKHLRALEKRGFLSGQDCPRVGQRKQLRRNYQLTDRGLVAYQNTLPALQELVNRLR